MPSTLSYTDDYRKIMTRCNPRVMTCLVERLELHRGEVKRLNVKLHNAARGMPEDGSWTVP